jgi:hypothetical protein
MLSFTVQNPVSLTIRVRVRVRAGARGRVSAAP